MVSCGERLSGPHEQAELVGTIADTRQVFEGRAGRESGLPAAAD